MAAAMDHYDKQILFQLDCDSRRSLSEVARAVRLGRDLVTYRIDRLKSLGILNKCTAMINPYKLGFTVYQAYLKLEANNDRRRELVALLDRHPNTSWLAECYGKWDLIWCAFARSAKEIYDLQDQLFSDYRDIIMSYNVGTLVNYWWFPKKYLVGKSLGEIQGWGFHPPQFTFGTTPAQHDLDRIEYGILQLLCEDAQLSIAEIAKRLRTTAAVVKYRIDRLEQSGIIPGYRVDLDRSLLGMTLFKVQVHPRDYDAQKERQFHEFCRSHPQISEYVQQLGDCRLEFVVEAGDYAQFNAVVDEVRERFANYVRSMDYMMIRRNYFHRTPCAVYAGNRGGVTPPALALTDSVSAYAA